MVFPNCISLELQEHLSSGEAAEPASLGPGLWRPGLAPFLALLGDCVAPEDQPPPAPSSQSSSTDDFCYVFLVELERGPSGLGMGLIDGMVSGPWATSVQCQCPVYQRWAHSTVCVVTGGRGRVAQQGLRPRGLVGACLAFERNERASYRSHLPTCCHFCPQTWGICPGPVGTVLVSTAVLADTMMTWARPLG